MSIITIINSRQHQKIDNFWFHFIVLPSGETQTNSRLSKNKI